MKQEKDTTFNKNLSESGHHAMSRSFSLVVILFLFLSAWFTGIGEARQNKNVTAKAPWQEAWENILPGIELFWKESEESQSIGKQAAWTIISDLKRFVQTYPDSPQAAEAYYVLGQAYAYVSFMPEALAHWRITAKKYPNTSWASDALMAILQYRERSGDTKKIRSFYREIIRQYPDTKAAKSAWIALAIDALNAGQLELVAKETERLEKASPGLYVEIPRFLDLKARIKSMQGKEEEARKLWLHYLNIIRQPELKAVTLFSIAESFRKSGKPLAARKYYAIVARDYPTFPEALFARFRLAQMEEAEQKRLRTYVKNLKTFKPSPAVARLFSKIIEEYPRHPITQEVEIEFMSLRLKEKRYSDVLRLAEDFGQKNPGSPYTEKVLKFVSSAREQLESEFNDVSQLRNVVELGKELLKKRERSTTFSPIIIDTAKNIWIKLIARFLKEGEYEYGLNEFWGLLAGFPDVIKNKKIKDLGTRLLLGFDAKLDATKNYVELLKYNEAHESQIEKLKQPFHFYYVGKAWAGIGCTEAADRAFYRAWENGTDQKHLPLLFVSWVENALNEGDVDYAVNLLKLFRASCPGQTDSAEALYMSAKVSAQRGLWPKAYDLASEALAKTNRSDLARPLRMLMFKAAVKLAEWDTAEMLWDEIAISVPKEKQEELLTFWGDEALGLEEPKEALRIYQRLSLLSPDRIPVSWRIAIARSRLGQKEAMEDWKALSQVDDPLWAKAAKAIISNEMFWSGPAASFRSQLSEKLNGKIPSTGGGQ